MGWNRTQIKAYTEEAFERLQPIDDVCNRFKFFINKHRGFKKDLLQDYINLFFFIDNEMRKENDIYKVTIKLLKRMFNIKSKQWIIHPRFALMVRLKKALKGFDSYLLKNGLLGTS